MSGLLYLIVGYIYWFVSSFLTRKAASAAKIRGIAGWKWGLPMAVLMYHLVFWDLIPTFVTLEYYCMTESGYWVYKTPEQWKVENPGVAETLNTEPDKSEIKRYWVKTKGLKRFYQLPDGTGLIAHYNVRKNYMYTYIRHNDERKTSWLNQRFEWVTKKDRFTNLKYLSRKEEKIVDRKTGEIMARHISFDTKIGGGISWEKIKFWQVGWQCFGWKHDLGIRAMRNKYSTLGESNE
jgi:hypothetical protein